MKLRTFRLRWPDVEIAGINLAHMNLRQRIAGTMMMLVTVAGLLLAAWAFITSRNLEQSVTYELLNEELTHYEQRLDREPGTEPLQTAQLRIYRSTDFAELPPVIARYAPGSYGPVRIGGVYQRVLVRDTGHGRLYITYDVTSQLRQQRIANFVMALGVLTTIVLTAWLAYALSGRLVDPVKQLATRLSDIDPGQRQLRISQEFVGNELAPIASSVDSFLERLDGFVEREQSFTATASHELRTPLAVIQGAVEILTEQHADQPHSQKALQRIQRAVREMAEFTDALLLLSREERREYSDSICDLGALLPRIIEDQQAASRQQSVQLLVTTDQPVKVAAPDSMVAMVVGNVIRNALQHSEGQPVVCQLGEHEIRIDNRGHLQASQLPQLFQRGHTTRIGGHGMGLYLARRICDRYGWSITLGNIDDRVQACIKFQPTAAVG
jgi:signal transduction histidine kinase